MSDLDYVKTMEGSIINTNTEELDRYKAARARVYETKELKNKVDKLEKDMTDIKELLISIHSRIE